MVRYDVGHSHEILLFPTSFGLCYKISIHFLYLEWSADKRCFMSHEAKRRGDKAMSLPKRQHFWWYIFLCALH